VFILEVNETVYMVRTSVNKLNILPKQEFVNRNKLQDAFRNHNP